jgi:L-ascorbate metabolism protein UlaG (beta-lactamase superfamily)
VPAWHTSTTPKGTVTTPAGLLINFKDTIVYHLGDTCLFSDLSLVGKRNPIDVALMCIGGHYTMDRVDAVDACGLVGAKTVIPCHYDTFPPIETDAQAFKSDVESAGHAQVVVLDPGQTHEA